ncbi:MAG TPA: site-specific DNA-methyltransferase [Armatimonadota bacterium]
MLDIPDIFDAAPDDEAPSAVAETPAQYGEKPVPFFEDREHGIRLYQGDSLELLRRIRRPMFDVIFADPPYFLSNNGITCQSGKMVSVNKGMWDKSETFEAIHEFNVSWLTECRRVLNPNGTIWVTGTNHNIYSVGFAMQTLGYKILNDIAWYKVNPPPNLSCRYFTHATETVLWARHDPKARHLFNYEAMKADNHGKQMQSLWQITPPANGEKKHGKHPTQKPEALLDRILRASSNPGDLVLDPFCGSGTTGVVAARLGRTFVGMDVDAGYLSLAVARIEDERGPAQIVFAFSTIMQREAQTPNAGRPITWAEIVADALRDLGGEGHLVDITQVVRLHPRARTTRTWDCTIRRVVRQTPTIQPLGHGRYRLAS